MIEKKLYVFEDGYSGKLTPLLLSDEQFAVFKWLEKYLPDCNITRVSDNAQEILVEEE